MAEYEQDQEQDEFRFLLQHGMAKVLIEIAKGLTAGDKKHPGATWMQIPTEEHLARAMRHIAKYCDGDKTENHLSHICMRALMAFAVAMREQEKIFGVSRR